MKLIYLANIRLPTEKAHGIQIMKMCEAFANAGLKVILVAPTRQNKISEDSFSYYGIKPIFEIRKITVPDLIRWGRIGFILQSLLFSITSFITLLFVKTKGDIIYSRDESSLFLPILFGWRNVFWEAHTPKEHQIALFVAKHASVVVPITHSLEDFFRTKGIRHHRMIVAHDATDINQFQIKATREECRKKIGLSGYKTIVLYAGHLYERKGVYTLADTISLLQDVTFVFVGGIDSDIASFRSCYAKQKNILVIGRKSHQDIPYYLKAADVVILPNSAKDSSSERYTSPMKLFEYMASGTPIVASDVTATREILNENNATLVLSDNVNALADGIKSVLSDSADAKKRSNQALSDVKNMYTWDKRADSIISFIKAI